MSGRNFNPVMATAAALTLVQSQHIREVGEIPPENVHTPGIFVHRLVLIPPAPEGLWTTRRQERAK